MEKQTPSLATLKDESPSLSENEGVAAELVIKSRLAGQFPIADEELIIKTASVWAQVLSHAKIPVEHWGKCLIEAMSKHTGKFPLHVGAMVAAHEEVKISLMDHRTIKQQITDFNKTRPARVENYGKHLELATWLRDMKQMGFDRRKITSFLNSKLSDRNYYFDLELLSVLTKEAKISETEWAHLQLDVVRVDFGVK